MHKIQEKEFTLDDFSCEYLVSESIANLKDTIKLLNKFRAYYNEYDVKNHFYIDNDSQNEWREFCRWIEELPYSELIIRNENKKEEV